MKIEKNRLDVLRKQIAAGIKQGQVTVDNNIIHMNGYKYMYSMNDGIISVECIEDPFTVNFKDCGQYIDVIDGMRYGRKCKSDKTLKKFELITGALYVVIHQINAATL